MTSPSLQSHVVLGIIRRMVSSPGDETANSESAVKPRKQIDNKQTLFRDLSGGRMLRNGVASGRN